MRKTLIILLTAICLTSCQKSDKGNSRPTDLRCEYSINPMGVDTDNPRFIWLLPANSGTKKQGYYQILVGTSPSEIVKGKSLVWDSGKTKSDATLVIYSGEKLEPNTIYYWTVKVWDERGNESKFSEAATFQTGLKGNWNAKWITDIEDVNEKRAPYFRKEVKTDLSVIKATVYLASAGLHELMINGQKVSDAFMNPIYTRFDKRVLYNTYDVTALLKNDNVIEVVLGNGWFNHQSTAVWDFHKASWRARPRFMFEMIVEYKDGSQKKIVSDKSWKTSFGKIQFNSIYTAEHVDNNQTTGDWKNVIEVSSPPAQISSQQLPPVRKVRDFKATSFTKTNDKTFLYDFGQNMSGITELTVKGKKGTILKVKHGEQLKDGHLNNKGLEVHYRPTDDTDPFQTDIYILNGEGEEVFSPKFNYKGFQYAEVTADHAVKLDENSLKAFFVHSDVEPVGQIETSNELIQKIWKATNMSYLSNLYGYPTDCPQREKNGWTGDGHIAIETGLFNYDGILVYEKWMDDHRDEQQADGTLPAIIPTSGWGYAWGNGPDWTSSMVLVPWEVYKFYGDKRILEENYENMKRYVNKIRSVAKNNLTNWGLGDWVPVKSKSNLEFTSSVFYYTDALILAKAAKLLGYGEDAVEYKNLAENIKTAINEKFFNPATNIYASGTQTEMSMALFRGIVPEERIQKVAENLANSVLRNISKLDVGLLGSKTILNALSENGYADMAFKLASSNEFPSWGYWIANGATTLYENWDLSAEKDLSLNHIMFGEINAWLYKALGGINIDENNPGFKNILLKPHFVDGLEDIKISHKGPHGNIVSSWKKEDSHVSYTVVIPPNSTAELYFDNSVKQVVRKGTNGFMDLNTPIKLESGQHEFTILNRVSVSGQQLDSLRNSFYPDGRPSTTIRMEAKDKGVILRHGDGPNQCDMLGAREALIFEEKGVYHLFYDGAGPKGWLACLATSKDLKNWEKKGPVLDFGKPGQNDCAAACSPWVYFDGKEWHMFYLGTPNTTPGPDYIPSFPYLTMKAKSRLLAGPWVKQPNVIPFRTKQGTYYNETASPGHIVKQNDEYLMFFSASMKRTIGIARTKDLNGLWTIDTLPIVSPEEQIENSSLYFEPANHTWFLFTNHIGLEGIEYTDAVWVYWTKDLNKWDSKNKAVVLDGKNCSWSMKCIGMPSVIRVGRRLAIFYDAPGGNSTSHMKRNIGLAWLELPLSPPKVY